METIVRITSNEAQIWTWYLLGTI